MAADRSTLTVNSREPDGSRAVRRLRRSGRVPGVLYGGDGDALSFDVDERELRHALAAAGAVLDLSIDGAKASPVVLKEAQRDPVRGETTHVDLLRVRLDTKIHAVVSLELTGTEDAPGVKQGGVLEQVAREVNIEALPTSIPESILYDVSAMEIGETVTLESLSAPEGVSLLDDSETVVVIVSAPRLQSEDEPEIESETGLVGEQAAGESGEGDSESSGGQE
jgi:large subunit ribosomal protein L25